MKNLFIMHTQYNLILSAAVMSRFKDAENTLVLYSEFTLSDELRKTLYEMFDRVIIVRDKFGVAKSLVDDAKTIRSFVKKTDSIKKERFDNIFMSQERIFDLVLCTRAKRRNPSVRCYNIEEDAYYSINEKYNQDDFVYSASRNHKFRQFVYALLLLGYPYNYRETPYCYGMSKEYDGANLLFPSLARRELKEKELIEITEKELAFGISSIYSDNKTDSLDGEKLAVFFFDLMNRYKNPENVKEITQKLIKEALKSGRKVLLKYHPRETDKFEKIEGTYEIPHIIPAEKVLLDIKDNDAVVVGNATTSCVVAAKLGFKVISICKIEFPTNKKIHEVMEKMGILCIKDANEIKNF